MWQAGRVPARPASSPAPDVTTIADVTEIPDVTDLLSRLIQFDTSNFGGGRSHGERACALWIAEQLRGVGFEPRLLHREDAPERLNVVLRVPGTEPGLEGLLLHAHTDVVPVEPEQWSVPPFEGLVRDGYVHGRGAQDMLCTVAAALHTLLVWGSQGIRPRRDVVVAFVADEEDAGRWGAEWLVEQHPELFEGLAVAIGESGGECERRLDTAGRPVNLYTINAGERGTMHIRLTARGRSGHGSRPSGDEAVTRLLRALVRIADHPWPLTLSDVVRGQFIGTARALGHELDLDDEQSVWRFVDWLGADAGPMRFTVRPSATPTILTAGYKVNVIPGEARAEVDVRCPPGAMEFVDRTLTELVGDDVEWEYSTRGEPLESPISGPWWDAMVAAIRANDPDAVVVPGCMGGGTDNKAFAKLGMATYGYTPAPADPEGRVAGGYHGVDERIPVSVLRGGAVMLRQFLQEV